MGSIRFGLLLLVASTAVSRAGDDAVLVGRVTNLATDAPVPHARVYVVTRDGTRLTVDTDAAGRYRLELPSMGSYGVVFTHGTLRDGHAVNVVGTTRVDGQLDMSNGEIIVIHDRLEIVEQLAVPRRAPPPYSTAAIEHNAWTRAWLVLDVDEAGQVMRVKFAKRPGYDLEATAVNEAWKLRFAPEHARTLKLWAFEWPSYWWLVHHAGTSTSYLSTEHVPCNGSGPLEQVAIKKDEGDVPFPSVYRDCSPPDLTKAASEPWIDRP